MTVSRTLTIARDGADDPSALEQLVRELRFNSPRHYADAGVEGGGDGAAGVMVSCASFPDKQRLEVVLPGVRVLSRANGVGDGATHTLVLAAPPPLTAQFLGADVVFQDHASALVERWFRGTDPGLVEDGFRASTIVRKDHGVCLRLLMATTDGDATDAAAVQDATCDVTLRLRLVGMYFRRQSYAAIWRLVSCTRPEPAEPPPCPTPDEEAVTVDAPGDESRAVAVDESKATKKSRAKAKAKPEAKPEGVAESKAAKKSRARGRYEFVSESESESGGEAEADDEAVPAWDEFEAMREDMLRRLEDRAAALRDAVDALSAESARLGAAQNQDIAALEAAAARLAASVRTEEGA